MVLHEIQWTLVLWIFALTWWIWVDWLWEWFGMLFVWQCLRCNFICEGNVISHHVWHDVTWTTIVQTVNVDSFEKMVWLTWITFCDTMFFSGMNSPRRSPQWITLKSVTLFLFIVFISVNVFIFHTMHTSRQPITPVDHNKRSSITHPHIDEVTLSVNHKTTHVNEPKQDDLIEYTIESHHQSSHIHNHQSRQSPVNGIDHEDTHQNQHHIERNDLNHNQPQSHDTHNHDIEHNSMNQQHHMNQNDMNDQHINGHTSSEAIELGDHECHALTLQFPTNTWRFGKHFIHIRYTTLRIPYTMMWYHSYHHYLIQSMPHDRDNDVRSQCPIISQVISCVAFIQAKWYQWLQQQRQTIDWMVSLESHSSFHFHHQRVCWLYQRAMHRYITERVHAHFVFLRWVNSLIHFMTYH